MKSLIPIPEGLELPSDASTKPFTLSGKFLQFGGKLAALELGGAAIQNAESEDSEEEDDGEDEEEGCDCGKSSCSECGQKGGGGFLMAVEHAMKPKR